MLTGVLCVIAAAAAMGNWAATATANQRFDWITKPTATAALLVIAASASGAAHPARPWWIVAFVGCLAGDVLLMLPSDRFVPGLVAFLAGHVAFVIGMVQLQPHGPARPVRIALAGATVIGEAVVVAWPVVGKVRRDEPALVVPLVAYMLTIWTMLAMAALRTGWWGIAGAVLFSVSDSIIAWERFVQTRRWMGPTVMITYHGALVGLLLALFH